MKVRILAAVAGLVALSTTPVPAHAYGSDTAANACMQAFVDTYLPKDRTVQIRWIPPGAGPLDAYSKRYTIDLSANLARSGNQVVSARCVATAGGKVIELTSS